MSFEGIENLVMDDYHMQELKKLRQGQETYLLLGVSCQILERMCQLHQLQAEENRYYLHGGSSCIPRTSKFDELSGALSVEMIDQYTCVERIIG